MSPYFRKDLIPLLEHGVGFAFPNLRGGGEYGEEWHRAGISTRKQTTFDDFIAAAEWLVDKHYASAKRLGMQGASNGGLVVATALTQRPDLFRAAVCKNPLTDMIRYPLFGEGQAWTGEYGSPSAREEFLALSRYSPYHQVTKNTSYPSTLIVAAAYDDRVDGMHARKMTASLQSSTGGPSPILFMTVEAGHSGVISTSRSIEELTDRTLFLMNQLVH